MPHFNIMFWRLMTHTTLWTNVIVKMTILSLLGSSDDKEKRGVARPEGPPLRGFQGTRIETFCYHRLNRRRAKWTHRCNHREGLRARVLHRINRRWRKCIRRCIAKRRPRKNTYTGWTDATEVIYVGALVDEDRGNYIHRLNRRCIGQLHRFSCPERWFLEECEEVTLTG